MRSAFILVYKVGLTLEEVNNMPQKERKYFFEFLKEYIDITNDQLKRN
jgi:hypothetical protein|tara:strand:+ start:213 stop:356 length:144 start_codon:yes stop_codon:yes gene_type:complete